MVGPKYGGVSLLYGSSVDSTYLGLTSGPKGPKAHVTPQEGRGEQSGGLRPSDILRDVLCLGIWLASTELSDELPHVERF